MEAYVTQFAELLTHKQVQRVHEASLEVLESVGILVHWPRAREIFAAHGCSVDGTTGLTKFPPEVIEQYRTLAPPSFTFRGRDPRFDRTIPDDGPVVVTGSSAPNVVDPVTGVERYASSADIARIAYLINELPGFDVFSISTLADDAPAGQLSLSRFYPALKNCLKPVRSNTPTMADLHQVIELGELIAGGKDAYQERPIINHHYCPMVSPLTMDVDSTEAVTYLTERGLPCYTTVVPNAGLTSPMTMMGTLVVGNAEFLAITCYQQMVREGTPVIYASLPTVADMRTGGYAPGAIETGILTSAQAQLARFYGVPSGGYIGLTNAHGNDAQSGFETGMNTVSAVLAGATLLNMGGLLSSLMAFDFGKAVIDNEIALMNKRMLRGLDYSEENLALEEIGEVGPGGSYMGRKHTKAHMRTTAVLPRLAARDMRGQWEQAGRPQIGDRALEEARRILSQPNPAVWDTSLDEVIRSHFPGIVAGDALPLESGSLAG
jgi:trimethylamine---corrinoid protein Co-methyltransferase